MIGCCRIWKQLTLKQRVEFETNALFSESNTMSKALFLYWLTKQCVALGKQRVFLGKQRVGFGKQRVVAILYDRFGLPYRYEERSHFFGSRWYPLKCVSCPFYPLNGRSPSKDVRCLYALVFSFISDTLKVIRFSHQSLIVGFPIHNTRDTPPTIDAWHQQRACVREIGHSNWRQ